MGDNKKRVVFFDFATTYGGAQHSLILLSARLNQFYDVYIIDAYGQCKKYLEGLAEAQIPVRVLMPDAKDIYIGHADKPLKRLWSFVKQLPNLWTLRSRLIENIKDIGPDLICTTSHKALFFLASSFSLRKYPIVIFAFGWFRKSVISITGRWLIRNRTDGVLAISHPTKQALQSWGVSENKIHVVYDVVELNLKTEHGRAVSTDNLPGTNSSFKILVPGCLLRTKGQHTAVKAAALLNRQGIDFVMWLAGGVAVADKSEYSAWLERLIVENNLKEKVFLLGWRNDIPDLMVSSDVVLLPSHTEGIPRVITEAMILKRPVATTPVGGIPDLVLDGQTGLLFPVEDENALSNCLKKLINNKDLGRSLAENAYKHIFKQYHPDRQIGLVVDAFERVIADKKTDR